MHKTIQAITIIIISLLSYSSCTEDSISTNPSYQLTLSTDTVAFDTLFTTFNSTTKKIKVYNNNKSKIKISSIYLENGTTSPFSINVNGRSSNEQMFTDIELDAKDSLYVFVNVNIDYNDQSNPMLFTDNITFLTNGNEQKIALNAVGQDAIILKSTTIQSDTTFSNTRPYLIFGTLKIDSGKTLTIEKGCQLYFHDQAGINIYGNINIKGTVNEPVTLRGDRLDYIFEGVPYDSLSGSWNGIKVYSSSTSNSISNTTIKNAINGIYSSGKDSNKPEISITNSIIHNCSGYGIKCQSSKVTVINTQVSNCGNNCVLLLGGESEFTHCTIANYYPKVYRKEEALTIKNYEDNSPYPIDKARFNNTIIFGSYKSELYLDSTITLSSSYNVKLYNCLIVGDEQQANYFEKTVWKPYTQTVFTNTTTYPYNFNLVSASPAVNSADFSIANNYPLDITGNSRIADGKPDIGAYEYK